MAEKKNREIIIIFKKDLPNQERLNLIDSIKFKHEITNSNRYCTTVRISTITEGILGEIIQELNNNNSVVHVQKAVQGDLLKGFTHSKSRH